MCPRHPRRAGACTQSVHAGLEHPDASATCAHRPWNTLPHAPHAGTHTAAQESIESAAELLYGLIHARFIITPRGMSAMLEKYKNTHFGRCPRAFCQGQPVLPVGQSDVPRMHTSKVFCPKCSVRTPRSSICLDLRAALSPPPLAIGPPPLSPPLPPTHPPHPLPVYRGPLCCAVFHRHPSSACRTFTTRARNAKPTSMVPTSAPPSATSSCKPTGTSCAATRHTR